MLVRSHEICFLFQSSKQPKVSSEKDKSINIRPQQPSDDLNGKKTHLRASLLKKVCYKIEVSGLVKHGLCAIVFQQMADFFLDFHWWINIITVSILVKYHGPVCITTQGSAGMGRTACVLYLGLQL